MSTAAFIISRVGKTLFDEAGVRWNEAELLEYITDAQKQIVLLKPSAYTLNAAVQLVPGTVQAIPAAGVQFIDLGANMGSAGTTAGSAVTKIDRKELDAYRPGWRAMTAVMQARHYIYDDRDPTRYEIFPPQPNPAGYVRLMYSAVPAVVSSAASELTLSAIYDTPIYFFVLARCFTKATSTQDLNKAAAYQNLAVQLVTGKKQAMLEMHPTQQQERTKQ